MLNSNTNVMMVEWSQRRRWRAAASSPDCHLDSIGEVRVLLGNYNAEYGRSGGPSST